MACEINASPSNGLVQSADGSGVIKLKSNGVTTNALAWVNFNGTGTVAIRSSYNVSSITDNGTGDYTLNFTTALSDANYSVTAMGGLVAGSGASHGTYGAEVFLAGPTLTRTTSSYRLHMLNIIASLQDSFVTNVTIHGN
jgi:hypothetical protein